MKISDRDRRKALQAALDYNMGLRPGAPVTGKPVDWVFIGSCTNSRICDLRAAVVAATRSSTTLVGTITGSTPFWKQLL